MEQQEKTLKKIFTIPNILSFFRLSLIPLIIWLYCAKHNYLWTGIIIILSGATDVIDGFIARRFNMVSDLGKVLDPAADKLTQLAVLICLVSRFHLMLMPIICMAIKEITMIVTGLLAIRKSGKVPSADWHGKVATVLLYGMMMLHIFWYTINPTVSTVSICISTAMILTSLVFYSIANMKILLTRGKKAD